MARSWRLVVRDGPRVERRSFATLAAALDELQARTVELAGRPRRGAVELKVRRFEPEEIVAARAEVRGPQRVFPSVRAGMDVHGDGTLEPWVGGGSKAEVALLGGETPWHALRRALAEPLGEEQRDSGS